MSVVDDLVIAFDAGVFEAYTLSSGQLRWRRKLGTAEPRPTSLGPKRLLLVLSNAIAALDTQTGEDIWRTKLRAPRAEIVVFDDWIYAATAEAIVALDRKTGEIGWTFDGLSTPVAGPVESEGRLVVPLASKIVVLDPETGQLIRSLPLHDELSAPLVLSPTGAVWALVGSDEVVHVPASLTKVGTPIRNLPGVDWPPVRSGEALILNAGPRTDRGALMYVTPKRRRARRLVKTLRGPIAQMDERTVVYIDRQRALIARQGRRKPRWKKRIPNRVTAWAASKHHVAAATNPIVYVLEGKKGREAHRIQLDGAIESIIYESQGGVALMKNGALYGLPSSQAP
ncbi:MAG: PQQ-binding-like beta-propeller repeat protein, partial [Myxococcota bacterium]